MADPLLYYKYKAHLGNNLIAPGMLSSACFAGPLDHVQFAQQLAARLHRCQGAKIVFILKMCMEFQDIDLTLV